MRKIIAASLVLIVVGAIVGAWLLWGRGHSDGGDIRVSGNIEVDEVQLGFRIAGLLVERPVDEGSAVHAGQVVGRLDDQELKNQVDISQAQVQSAQAVLSRLQAGSRPEEIDQAKAAMDRAAATLKDLEAGSRQSEIEAAQAGVAQAKADVEFREKDLARVRDLNKQSMATANELDIAISAEKAAKASLDQAQAKLKLTEEGSRPDQITAARHSLQEATKQYELVKIGPRQEDIDKARADLSQASESLKLARTKLSYTVVTSPVDGVILSKNAEVGDVVAANTPVLTAANLRHVYLRAYVDEPDLGKVKLGQNVAVTTDTYPGRRYSGKITFISQEAEFTPKNVQTPKERVKLVYRVKIDIDNPEMELKPGMPADAVIEVGANSRL